MKTEKDSSQSINDIYEDTQSILSEIRDCDEPNGDIDSKNWFDKIWKKITGIADDVTKIVKSVDHLIPSEYRKLHESVGGAATLAKDGLILINNISTENNNISEVSNVFADIESEFDDFLTKTGLKNISNPMKQFNVFFNKFDHKTKQVLIGATWMC